VTVGSTHAARDRDVIDGTKNRASSTFVAVVLAAAAIVGTILLMTLTN
jgi:hypothetical protein